MGSALGVAKTAARKVGCSVEVWLTRRAAGERWCTTCRHWHDIDTMTRDAGRADGIGLRCKPCASQIRQVVRATYRLARPGDNAGALVPGEGDNAESPTGLVDSALVGG